MTRLQAGESTPPNGGVSPPAATGPRPAGRLITLEGIDGAGKTTQLSWLGEWLQPRWPGGSVVLTREPGGTTLGKSLRSLLLSPDLTSPAPRAELLLYAADRAQHVDEVVRPALATGAVVLSDRFVDSTLAYQGYGRGLGLDLLQRLNTWATDGLHSDLTLWFDLPVEVAIARRQQRDGVGDRLEQSRQDFYERVRAGFAAIAAAEPGRVVRIEAAGTPEETFAQVQAVVGDRCQAWAASASLK